MGKKKKRIASLEREVNTLQEYVEHLQERVSELYKVVYDDSDFEITFSSEDLN